MDVVIRLNRTSLAHCAPQLVALQIRDVDTFEVVVEFYRTHNEESDKGIKDTRCDFFS